MDFDEEYEEEYEDNSINIEYYPYPDDIKYKVEIDNEVDNVGLVSFHHRGKLILSRDLSKFEIKSVLASLKILKFPIFYDRDDFLLPKTLPCITSTLAVKTPIVKIEFSWDNTDEEAYANELLAILVFKDLIESLIEIDFSNLDMPIYM